MRGAQGSVTNAKHLFICNRMKLYMFDQVMRHEVETTLRSITTPELDLPPARTSPLPSTSMAPPDEIVPSSQVSNLDMFKDDDIDFEDLMVAECSHITQDEKTHHFSIFRQPDSVY